MNSNIKVDPYNLKALSLLEELGAVEPTEILIALTEIVLKMAEIEAA